jgi:hypothetical protein
MNSLQPLNLNIKMCNSLVLALLFTFLSAGYSQDSVFYSGTKLSSVDYHHGQLPLAKGVHNIQVMRANREHPELGDGFGWTYNHAPNLAFYNETFYLQYLSDSVGEHIPPSQSFLVTSKDGYHWEKPIVAFPPYPVPDGTTKEGQTISAKNLTAIMHQRMGFYTSKDNRFLMLGYYGLCLHKRDSPNDGKGIGRVVREISKDGSLGPIYFIRCNKNWNSKNTNYPFYKKSRDKGFVKACDELLNNPLMMQQWNEESDRDDPVIPQTKEYKAFCYYHLPDNRIVGLWKHALFQINNDKGNSWNNVRRAPGFVNKNAKIWGQKTPDGKYVTVYNPSQFRWPLALSVSDNGLEYTNLLLVNGEISTMRYGGNYKSYGPQYVRGIIEGNGNPSNNSCWVTYSMNKEDIWVSKIPVPISGSETNNVLEVFNDMKDGSELQDWNIFSPCWAPVKIETYKENKYLVLRDKDPFDYAKAERLFPESEKITIEFEMMAAQNNHGMLHIEFQDNEGNTGVRMVLNSDGNISVKDGYRMSGITEYEPGKDYNFKVELDTRKNLFHVYMNGKKVKTRLFFNPLHSLERVVFRTGEVRRFPNADTPTDQNFDVPESGSSVKEAAYYLKSFKTY